MKIVFFVFFGTLLFMMSGCSKELSVEMKTDTLVIKPDTTYQPLEANSAWVYKDSATGVTTTIAATDSDTVINNKTYTVFHVTSAGQTADEYFSINSHNYFSYGNFGNGLVNIELLYLNDTASPGYNWQASAGTVNGYPAQVQGEILDTGLTVTIGTNTFSHVIHTEISLAYNVGGGFQTPYAIYDYYVAKGIGIIKIESSFPTVGFTSDLELVSYTIQ